MDLLDTDREEGFHFVWTIQNYNFCFRKNKKVCFESPMFQLSNDKVCLDLYPKRYFSHDSIGIALRRYEADLYLCTAIDRELMLELSIRDVKGSFIKKLRNKLVCKIYSHISDIVELKINKEESVSYLNNDSLTIKCKILDLKYPAVPRQCYYRTEICFEKITYPCTMEIFENGASINKRFLIYSKYSFYFMKIFPTTETNAEKKIEIAIKLTKPNNSSPTCEISLVDPHGNIFHSVQDEHYFINCPKEDWAFTFVEIIHISNNTEYLSNGVFRLQCEFVVSYDVKYNEVERTEYGIGSTPQLQGCDQPTNLYSKESLKENLKRCYAEGKFSDLTIRTLSKEFHKTILCARSEVFSAMFEREMNENKTVVEIEDIDDDTVSKLLLFMYTDTIREDLESRTASSLYFAADKYRIMALKKKCADFLKSIFTVTNVCDVLVLADMHQDQELKSSAQSFNFEHSGTLMDSEEWKKFMGEKADLTSEVMHAMLKRLKLSSLLP